MTHFWRGRPTRKCKIHWFQCSKKAKFGGKIPSKYQNVKSSLSISEPFSTDITRWILLMIYRLLKIYTMLKRERGGNFYKFTGTDALQSALRIINFIINNTLRYKYKAVKGIKRSKYWQEVHWCWREYPEASLLHSAILSDNCH